MKKYFFLIVAFAMTAYAYGQQAAAQNGPVVTFEKSTHDFGDITQGDKVQHIYKFTNTGNEPLLITNVEVQCGCTKPTWPKEPIAPGAQGELVVGFDSMGKSGAQFKVVTLVSNAINAEGKKVSFTTNVLPKKETPQR
jgi:hypothetical protein